MIEVTSWGRLPARPHHWISLSSPNAIAAELQNSSLPGIPQGMARSYGDVCLNPHGTLWNTTALNHFISFNEKTGLLTCEAGILLRDIQRLMVPRGWILAVTPGTQLITVGGAIANDVHGKNHHIAGSFGDHIRHLVLIRTNGDIIECSPEHNRDWLTATIGGLGLTGVISQVTIQLQKTAGPWLDTETIPYNNLQDFFSLSDQSEHDWQQTVSWIDCLNSQGRGLFMRANSSNHQAEVKHKQPLTMPIVPPISLVNRLSLKPFNTFYYHLKKQAQGRKFVHYEPFSYPLDNLQEWNRMYGPKGFYQYQSVVPRAVGQDAVQAMLQEISRSGEGSFLAVLKTFGKRESLGMLSFPQPGVTLALDFPNKDQRTHKLFDRLDAIVREAKGRLYPAKDARMPKDLFEAGYPRLSEFLTYRDPGISSGMSRRLMDF